MLKKMNKKDTFWKTKEDFIKSQAITASKDREKEAKLSLLSLNVSYPFKSKSELDLKNNLPKKGQESVGMINIDEEKSLEIDRFRESENTMQLFKESEQKDLDKTKKILFELSDLMTNFSAKVLEHQQITQTSILFIIF